MGWLVGIAIAVAIGIALAPFLGWIALIIALLIGGVIVFIWLGELSDAIAPRIPSGVATGGKWLSLTFVRAYEFALMATIAFGVIVFPMYLATELLGVDEVPLYISWIAFVIPPLFAGWWVFGRGRSAD